MARQLLATLLLASITSPASAQLPNLKSQLGGVTQMVAGTRIEVVYRRPVARGREIFGALVPYGKIWTPSADSAARVTFSTAVTINGAELAAGTYGIWTIPEASEWTVIFNRSAEAFHLRYPSGQDALRVKAAAGKGEHVETLQFSFPMVDADSATLQLHWGTTIVPLMVRVRP